MTRRSTTLGASAGPASNTAVAHPDLTRNPTAARISAWCCGAAVEMLRPEPAPQLGLVVGGFPGGVPPPRVFGVAYRRARPAQRLRPAAGGPGGDGPGGPAGEPPH